MGYEKLRIHQANVSSPCGCCCCCCRHWSADPGNADKFPLFVSVDGDHQPTLILATSLQFAVGAQVVKVQRDSSSTACTPAWDAYCNLALHYKELLKLFFECLEAPRLILLEEDLVVAPDFFSYFEATAPLLDQDSSLYCISAWNDQGQVGRALNHTALYRTDGEGSLSEGLKRGRSAFMRVTHTHTHSVRTASSKKQPFSC